MNEKTDEMKKAMIVLIDLGEMLEKIMVAKPGVMSKLTAALSFALSVSGDLAELKDFNFSELKDEVKNLKPEDKADLLAYFKSKFDLEDDKLESKVELGLSLLLNLEQSVQDVIAFAKA